jgi:hypothetical protein
MTYTHTYKQTNTQDAWQWYSQEALPRFTEANASETLEPLKELLDEAGMIVTEVRGT